MNLTTTPTMPVHVNGGPAAPTVSRQNISGVFPHLAVLADHGPQRSETGIGALMPWADRLWFVTYVAHLAQSGAGTGLFEVDNDLNLKRREESVVGTYANRMIHTASDQLVMGPHLIDTAGRVRTADGLAGHRLTASMEHLFDEHKYYTLTMEGLLLETDARTLKTEQVFDLLDELQLPPDVFAHFKGGYTSPATSSFPRRVVVANNTYNESDALGQTDHGRLAEWDGKEWRVLARAPFVEATGRKNMGEAIFASGWDRASVILKTFSHGEWKTYRLPKSTQTQDNTVTTEWPRIREVESERLLMNIGGMFYEMPYYCYGGHLWGVRPICTHLRIIGDFCSWRGMLVLAGDQTTPIWDKSIYVGQPQANLWLGKTDDLWQFGGKPSGWGGPWWEQEISAGEISDPYLMTGFDKKSLHLSHDAGRDVTFKLEIDFQGTGRWHEYSSITVGPGGYAHHEFPDAFSAHWVRLTANADCTATAYFHYT